MSLDKMKNAMVAKLGEKDFNNKLEEFKNDAKEFGIPDEELDKYLGNRFLAFFTKSTGGTKLERVEGEMVFVCKKKTDYGREWQYNKASEMVAKGEKDKALKLGYIDVNGNPLQINGFNQGKLIDLSDFNYIYLGITKVAGAEEWVKTMMVINSKLSMHLPLFVPIKGMVGKKTMKDKEKEFYNISLGVVPEGKLAYGEKLNYESMCSLLTTYYSDGIYDFVKLNDVDVEDFNVKQKSKGYERCDFVYGSAPEGVTEGTRTDGKPWTRLSLSVMLSVEELEALDYQVPAISAWIDDDCSEKNIVAGATNVIAIGQLKADNNEDFGKQFSMNGATIYVEDRFILKPDEKAEIITPTNGKSEPEAPVEAPVAEPAPVEPVDENQFA